MARQYAPPPRRGDGPRRSCESEMKMMMLENGPENVMSTPSMFYKGQPVRAYGFWALRGPKALQKLRYGTGIIVVWLHPS